MNKKTAWLCKLTQTFHTLKSCSPGVPLKSIKKENFKREALNLKNTSSITVKKTVGLNPKKPF